MEIPHGCGVFFLSFVLVDTGTFFTIFYIWSANFTRNFHVKFSVFDNIILFYLLYPFCGSSRSTFFIYIISFIFGVITLFITLSTLTFCFVFLPPDVTPRSSLVFSLLNSSVVIFSVPFSSSLNRFISNILKVFLFFISSFYQFLYFST